MGFLNARDTFHRVTEVTGYRLSIIYHTPQHLHRLSSEDWDILRDTGFPVDAVWEQGLTNQDESDEESDLDHQINEVVQSIDTPKTLSRQTSAEEAQGPLMELDDGLEIPWSSLRPTMQTILWLSDLVARYQLRPDVIPGANPKLHKAMATLELREMDGHLQRAKQAPMELTVILMCMANIILIALRLAVKLGAHCQLGVLILHLIKPTQEMGEDLSPEVSTGICRAIAMIPIEAIYQMGLTKRGAKRGEYHAQKLGKQSDRRADDSHPGNKPEPGSELNPWTAWISQMGLNEQEVPEFFRTPDAMKQTVEIVEDEEVLQTTTCTPKDIDKDPKGWKVAFRDELDSFDRLDVMDSVPLNTLDTSTLDILPCKVVMVKKPQGDGTHRKKGRVVVCGNFQQVQPGEETCANTPSFPMLRTLISLAALYRWAVESWDVSTAFLYAPLIEKRDVYCKPPQVLVKLGLVQPGTVWKLKKALYGLRTSPRAWEEERDRKLSTLTWDSPVGRVGLKSVDTTHCVWTIRQQDNTGDPPPLGMVIAYVDDLIAVGDQSQLDCMKSELDKLYVMKTSGSIPAQYPPALEPLRFLGCLIERMPDGQIIMHQRSYIEHCFRENDMELMKGGVTLPNVDEKGSPVDQYGHPTEFEKSKSTCQKYIGQLMWLATRTRPDISPVLGMIASQMVIRPTEMVKCLTHLWRYIKGTSSLSMTSFFPNPSSVFGKLRLNVYVDASFSSGGSRSRSGMAMYLVDTTDGSESIIQWASRRQTSMATSAPEAEVTAMAEGFATAILSFLIHLRRYR